MAQTKDKLYEQVYRAEDAHQFKEAIGWDTVVRPDLERFLKGYTTMLINETMGLPNTSGLTREQIGGMCYGINFILSLFEQIQRSGEKALKDLRSQHNITF